MKTVAVSGGFDPIHIGHIRLFNEAKKLADRLVVIINNDNWLRVKKGYNFMPEEDRAEIISNLKAVDEVVLTTHKPDSTDVSCCDTLRKVHPDIFANGGDRKEDNVPEYDLCEELGIEMKFNIGGKKIRSSSSLVSSAKK